MLIFFLFHHENTCCGLENPPKNQGPVVQSIVSLTSLLVVKILTVLVNTISNSQVYLLKNMSSFHIFFSKNISLYAIFNDKNFNDMLTNDIVSFEQLGPDIFLIFEQNHMLLVFIRNALMGQFL